MGEELPILKGILNGVVNYHNAPVRFGRVPKREKARILAAMHQCSQSKSSEKQFAAELEDESRLLSTVVRAHLDTCDYTREKIESQLAKARENPQANFACAPTLTCPLNPNSVPLAGQQELLSDFSKRFSPAIRGVVDFAKRIPGFSFLPQEDQVTLLKAGVFEVLLVRLACMFDAQTNSMMCLNGQLLKRDSIHHSSNARFLMDSMFDFAERLNTLRLTDAEIGLFSSVIVIAADRHGLRNVEQIERMQNKLKTALQIVINQNHPDGSALYNELMKKIPDLRTLNTLHSEKLLAFKMVEQQHQQSMAQQHQQNMWNSMVVDEETNSKSPGASSSWSSSSDVTIEEVTSPLGSVSSTESMCSGEVASLNEYHTSHHATNAPLLAATLAGGVCPHRLHTNSGSSSGDDLKSHPRAFRKLDSPSDSGIESGTEKLDRPSGSAPTSVCSSPRSSLEDHKEDHKISHPHIIPQQPAQQQQPTIQPTQQNGNHSIEDMPVLKRVLQAPPLYDTNSLMDEAYKPHKKFRALRNKDSAEAEPMVQNSPQLHHHLTSSSLSSTHSTLAKSLMEGPRMTPEQLKRTEVIHDFIMRGDCPYNQYNNIPSQKWQPVQMSSVTSVITTNTSSPAYVIMSNSPSPPSQTRIYLSPSPSSSTSANSPSPSMMELQVGIGNAQQPLNLSKKTPPTSPRSTPSHNSLEL